MNVLESKRNREKLLIQKLENVQGNLVYERNEITTVMQVFYQDLYNQTIQLPVADIRNHAQPVINAGSEEIPEMSELRTAIGQLKNGKALGEDGITSEMPKIRGKTLEKTTLIAKTTADHIQSIRTLIKKCTEYNIPLHLAFVDYHKAFDFVETWATMQEKIDDELTTEKILINRAAREGDTICPELFTLTLEDIFKMLPWQDKGISIDRKHLIHLRCRRYPVGLTMNIRKTKIMSTDNVDVTIENQTLEVMNEYNYLGHIIKVVRDNQTSEINHRSLEATRLKKKHWETGPGERCGGSLSVLGVCGEGMMCKSDEKCHGCSMQTMECFN
ncbi:unnamed protein product [Ceutorhynchus assimilis]|uniref:Reverse transcriptase domain-containing protein n=1 Tax=Ceutorhynchus assimilis TaxID=467358 RepID=A0A9N9QCL3_9CUCU|nr:unnamed protein product [Ceutorhynchus assimilis]